MKTALGFDLPPPLEFPPKTELICPIEMYFGSFVDELLTEALNQKAIDSGCSVEHIYIAEFEALMNSHVECTEERNFFDSCFMIHAQYRVHAPRIKAGHYMHSGFKLPKLTLEDKYMLDEKRIKRYLISDETIDKVGTIVEFTFGYEYLGFKRLS
jgi:hypothetical protein